MDIATMRKRGSKETISRQVCVTSIRIPRSGVRRKSHAPFWSSGRRSDPPIDCNRLNLTIRQHIAAVGRRVSTLCKGEDGLQQQLAVFHCYYNFCLPHASVRLPLPQPELTCVFHGFLPPSPEECCHPVPGMLRPLERSDAGLYD